MELNNLSSIANDGFSSVNEVFEANTAQKASLERTVDTKLLEETKEKQLDPEEQKENLFDAVDKLNKTARIFNSSLEFKIHEETKRTMVSVIDNANDKVIRQIPSEEVLDMFAKIEDYVGLIFDKKG